MLEQCDLSNTQMIKGTMQRTKLTDCKLVGISLTEAFLLDPVERCVARYANLYGSKMRHVRLTDSDFSSAALSGCTLPAQRPSRGVRLSARSSSWDAVPRHGSIG